MSMQNDSAYPQQFNPELPPKKKHPVRNTIIGVVAAFALIGACTSSTEDTTDTSASATESESPATATETEAPAAESTVKAPPTKAAKPKPAPPAKPALSPEQEQAVGSAEQYLHYTAFSKQGLINQLTQAEGYSRKDATVAVNSIKVDWNEQAAKSAQQYLDYTHFSRQGLINQLVQAEHFTRAQAEYGVSQTKLG